MPLNHGGGYANFNMHLHAGVAHGGLCEWHLETVALIRALYKGMPELIGDRLVLKIVSPQITHKTEVGGVMLDVPAAEAGAAYDRLIERVKARAPGATLDGVLMSPMVRGGVEMILGVQDDAVFGPVVLLGLGGIFVEVLRDVTFRIAPFGVEEAHRMIGELRGATILEGARGQPPADLDALATALSRLSLFAAAQRGRFTSIDINPLLVRAKGEGAAALDALILTAPAGSHG